MERRDITRGLKSTATGTGFLVLGAGLVFEVSKAALKHHREQKRTRNVLVWSFGPPGQNPYMPERGQRR